MKIQQKRRETEFELNTQRVMSFNFELMSHF
jgi:hypothetical protein